jgi:tRNA threonylcarbamoyladenosine biosynthesis protein TsaB
MKVLALDGALGAFSAAVADGERILGAVSETGNVALESGLSLVASLLAASGMAPRSLDRLAIGTGPGGFTGLRIAIAYAKSLAQAWELPLVPLSSFDLLEYGRDLESALTVVVGRPGVISARFREGTLERRGSGFTADVLEAIALPQDGRMLDVLGAPEDVLGALAERGMTVNALSALVAPAVAAALASQRREAARTPHEVRADYGELPAAKVPKR